jgi:hypothetical protein
MAEGEEMKRNNVQCFCVKFSGFDSDYCWRCHGPDVHTPMVEVHEDGSLSGHDYACPVCLTEHAELQGGAAQPCPSCQRKGWSVTNKNREKCSWWRRRKSDAEKVDRHGRR